MKYAIAAALAAYVTIAGAAPASAEIEYPYCIINGGRDEGSWNCGFVTLAQCMATRVGTDMCVSNPRYQAPQPAQPRERARHRAPG